MSQLIAQMFQEGAVKVKHDLLLLFTGKTEQNITTKIHTKKDDSSEVWHWSWHPWIFRGAVHSGYMQCIPVKSDEFENSYSLLYILFKSCLCCCSLATLAPQQLMYVCTVDCTKLIILCYLHRLFLGCKQRHQIAREWCIMKLDNVHLFLTLWRLGKRRKSTCQLFHYLII